MKQKSLSGQKAAILVANGFSEQDLIRTQRAIQDLGGITKIISMDQGLVNSWNGTGWGLNFAADHALNESLAADYSILVIPGGERSTNKLRLTAHTKRFINGFMAMAKPVVALNDAVELVEFTELLDGRQVASASEGVVIDGNLLTCMAEPGSDTSVEGSVESFLIAQLSEEAVAA